MLNTFVLLVTLFCALSPVAQSKITVHLVPHTHDDVGWLKTVDEYLYGLNMTIQAADVNAIIGSAIGGLLSDSSRKFTYVEMAFFYRWWNQQSIDTQTKVKDLVGKGQLQFANGGWCMHDEAAAHFIDMIDQTTTGHRFLHSQFKIRPKVGWQVDPFGHSATQVSLLSARVGFLATYHARIDYQDYQNRIAQKAREFWWAPSPSMPNARVFGGVLLDTTYCTPSGFDWEIFNVVNEISHNSKTNFIVDNPNSPQNNVQDTVNRFVTRVMQHAAITQGDNIMWTMGCDFNYAGGQMWFDNLDKLIRIVNADGRVKAVYSTPYEYTVAKLVEHNVSYPTKTDDFFPYADGPHQFWTGYFSSRPAWKRYIRTVSSFWTASRQIQAAGWVNSGDVPPLADALGIAQHHDSVTGTAKQHVTFDYAKRLYAAYAADISQNVNQAFQNIVRDRSTLVFHCPLSNESVCSITQSVLNTNDQLTMVVWNSLGHAATRWVDIPVPVANVNASGPNVRNSIIYTASEAVKNYGTHTLGAPYTLSLLVELPAAGYSVVTLQKGSSVGRPSVEKKQQPNEAQLETKKKIASSIPSSISGGSYTLGLDSLGRTRWLYYAPDFLNMTYMQDWCYFQSNTGDTLSGQPGGAYIFRPVTNTSCMSVNGGVPHAVSVIVQSSFLSIIEQQFDFITQRYILRGDTVELEFTVHEIPINDGFGKELMARFTPSSIQNGNTFYTDSNGREMQKRVVNYRPTWNFVQTEPVAGNFYPTTSLVYLKDNKAQFNVFPDAAMSAGITGVSGQVYFMVHRRLIVDDHRGVYEPINETEFITSYASCPWRGSLNGCGVHYGRGLQIRGRFTLSISSLASGTTMSRARQQMDKKYFEAIPLFLPESTAESVPASVSLLNKGVLPLNVQLITAQRISRENFLVRLGHQFAVGEDSVLSQPAVVNLTALLNTATLSAVTSIDEVSLTTTDVVQLDVQTVTINPMDVRTFMFHLLS